MNAAELRYRQIHLDFHTSEAIASVGSDFDPDAFADTLARAHVNQVTLFARGHHGWSYYPTSVGTPHPHLEVPDLLGEQIAACRKRGIETFVYNTVQWDELTARMHPEWRAMTADGAIHAPAPGDHSTSGQLSPTWHPICLSNSDYVQHVADTSLEQIARYQPTGIFLDILLDWQCVCPRCLARMEKAGLDPGKEEDRLANDRAVIMDYYRTVHGAISRAYPDVRIFHNSGHIYRGDRERYSYFSHLELESLPTGGWGYDHFPMSVTYAATLGFDVVGMTGKFHTLWGEFGGYKTAAALEYECAMMVAHGAACSIGDQLHPRGALDPDTYARIAPAYARVKAAEPFVRSASLEADIAVLSEEAFRGRPVTREDRTSVADAGVSRMLLQLHYPFHLIDQHTELDGYQVVIVPDTVTLDESYAAVLREYLSRGGRVLTTGRAGANAEGVFFNGWTGQSSGDRRPWNPDYILVDKTERAHGIPSAPTVVYQSMYRVSELPPSAEVFAWGVQPYFNRSYRHFCSHQHAPPVMGPDQEAVREPAMFQAGQWVHCALPLFTEYYNSGQPIARSWLDHALKRLGYTPSVRVGLPTAGKVTVTRQEAEQRLVLHCIYAPSVLRGNGLRYPEGHTLAVEIIDDVPEIRDVAVSVVLPEEPRRVHLVNANFDLPYEWDGQKAACSIPSMYIHEAVVFEMS